MQKRFKKNWNVALGALALALAVSARADAPAGAVPAPPKNWAGANTLLENQDYAAAAAAYEALGEQSGRKRECWRQNNWGLALLRLNKPAEAVEHFEKAVEVDPGNFTPRANLGAAWERVGDRTKALDVYRRALELIKQSNQALMSGASSPALERERQAQTGVSPTARLEEKASQLSGDDLKEALRKASELLDAGKYQEASAAYAAIGQTAPAQREGWRLNNWGLCYLRLGDALTARERLERSVEVFPGNPVAWNNLAIACEQLGLVDRAKEALTQAAGPSGSGGDPQRFELSRVKLDFAAERRRWEALSR
jgi:tetratricopeptide (TPR) repeat protein